MQRRTEQAELREVDAEGDAPSLASLWKCPNCHAQVQIVVAPAQPCRPFACMCGTEMVAGEDH